MQSDASRLILVTGGCGFIGANVVRGLAAKGFGLRVLDDLSTGRRSYIDGVVADLRVGDVCDPVAVGAAVRDCWGVVHLAAQTSVQESLRDPQSLVRVNVASTVRLLEACVAYGVERFIFASSNAALGEQQLPLNETTVASPISPYGASKLAGEAFCSAFHGAFQLGTVALRFANVYGPFSEHKTSVIAKFMNSLINGSEITIYGDGLQTRDFVYAADLVSAVFAALQSRHAGEVFQIATGRETRIIDLVRELEQVCALKAKIQWRSARSGDILRNVASIDKARSLLGFQPEWNLSEGLAETLRWREAAEMSSRRQSL